MVNFEQNLRAHLNRRIGELSAKLTEIMQKDGEEDSRIDALEAVRDELIDLRDIIDSLKNL